MAYLTTSAAWTAPREISGWISPSEVAGWVSPSEVAGWVSPYESGQAAMQLQIDPSLQSDMFAGAGGQGKNGESGDVLGLVGDLADPVFDALKFWTGGSEIEQEKAKALVADAQAKQELAKAQALMALKTKPKGIDTQTILLLGGAALAVFLLMR